MGRCLVAFSCKLGCCSIAKTELRAILHGLHIIRERRIGERVLIESDSTIAVNLINEGCSHPCFALVQDIVSLIQQKHVISCSHIFREVNQVVDVLVKHRPRLEKLFRFMIFLLLLFNHCY
uniref:Ribonuclease H protein At1g65750 family n=1 Tax=Cajanus cajan TaxID=3821 RepID=A0A151R968_CAJCA|nr:Putative ribonuclease H protein At1g65750 family [Cajanus cajan]